MNHGRSTCPVLSAAVAALALAACAIPASAQSLIANGGFETNGSGWLKFGNADFCDWAKQTGNCGVALQGWVFNGAGGVYQSVAGEPGLSYTFKINGLKEPLFQASQVYLRLEFYTADNTTKSGHDQGTLNVASMLTTNWQTFTITGVAPLGTAYVRPVIGFDGATTGDLGSGRQACKWDNAELTVSEP